MRNIFPRNAGAYRNTKNRSFALDYFQMVHDRLLPWYKKKKKVRNNFVTRSTFVNSYNIAVKTCARTHTHTYNRDWCYKKTEEEAAPHNIKIQRHDTHKRLTYRTQRITWHRLVRIYIVT